MCNTAYATSNGTSNTLPSICFLPTLASSSNNWGWTNGLWTPSTFPTPAGTNNVFNIYAGAAQCNLAKGKLVGTLTVTCTGLTCTFSFNLNYNNYATVMHLWVGTTQLPYKSGKAVTAPGQFGNTNPYSTAVQSGSVKVTLPNSTDKRYFAAHFGTCSYGGL